MISISNLHAGYAHLPVLFGVDLTVKQGETLALIGANGAGKSTTFSILTGFLKPTSGAVMLGNEDLARLSPRQIVEAGIALVPEGRRLFPSLSVEENLLVGAHAARPGPWTLDRVYDVFPTLTEFRSRPSTALSGGQQQLVAIGRALMSNPQVLLCDELSLGLSPAAVTVVYRAIARLKEEGLTLVIVEHDIARALSSSNTFACMRHGQIVLQGASSEASRDAISQAYFGMH